MSGQLRIDSLDYLPLEGSYCGLAIGAFASLLIALVAAGAAVGVSRFVGVEVVVPVMVLVPVGSLGALTAGLAALDSMDRRKEVTRGRWMAWVGIVGGGVMCLGECVMAFRV